MFGRNLFQKTKICPSKISANHFSEVCKIVAGVFYLVRFIARPHMEIASTTDHTPCKMLLTKEMWMDFRTMYYNLLKILSDF